MIKFCKTCIMPNSRPRIVFDEHDVCNACENSKKKNKLIGKKKKEFLEIISKIKDQKIKIHIMIVLCLGQEEKTQVQSLIN